MRLWGALAVLWLVAGLPAVVSAASIEAVVAGGFGRLAIAATAPATVSSRQVGEVLEIESSAPFPADVSTAASEFASLLDSLTLANESRVLRLRPAAGVVIEAVELDAQTIMVGLATEMAPLLGLRLGHHDAFRRAVIEPVDHQRVQLERAGDRLTLLLPGRLARVDQQRLAGMPGVAEVAMAGDQLFLTFSPGTVVRDLFVAPDKQVLDISVTGTSEPGTVLTPAADAAAPTDGQPATPRPMPRPGPVGPKVAVEPSEAASTTTTASSAQAREPEPVAALGSAIPVAADGSIAPIIGPLTIDAQALSAEAVELRFAWPQPVPAAIFVRGNQLWAAFGAESTSIAVQQEAFTRTARRFVRAVRQQPHPTATLFQLTLNDAVVSSVDRAGGLWRIGLTSTDSNPGTAFAESAPPFEVEALGDAILLPGIDATLSFDDPTVGDRLDVGLAVARTGPLARARRFVGLRLLSTLQGAVWQKLSEGDQEPRRVPGGIALGPLDGVLRAPDGSAPSATAPVETSLLEAPLPADDTTLLGTPLRDEPGPAAADAGGVPTEALAPPLAMPPQAVPSAAVVATLQEPPEQVEPAVPEPLSASSNGSVEQAAEQFRPLDLARFAETPELPFWALRAELLEAANGATGQESETAQLDLARLHIAHGLGAEASSLLARLRTSAAGGGDVEQRRAQIAQARQALEGSGLLLRGQFEEALVQLAAAAQLADDETALWRGAARAALEDWDAGLADWRRGAAFLDAYPPTSQAVLGELGALLLLQTGQINQAFALLDRLMKLPLPTAMRDRLQLLEAMALDRDGAQDEAQAVWRRLVAQGVPEVRSQAQRALIDSDLQLGNITAAEAAERLAASSVEWRGQSGEVALWRRLAALQRAAGEPETALATLQNLLARESAAPLANALAAEMAAIVDELFDGLESGQRSATSMLLTYRRFAELIPAGASGDAGVVMLADQLGDLGLNEPAIELLRDRLRQDNKRDEARARLGLALATRLAQSGDRRGAVAALLDTSAVDDIDPALAAARRELLVEFGEADEADEAESGSRTLPVEQQVSDLRDWSRTAFDRAAWPEVVATLASVEALLPDTGPLDRSATEALMMVATAALQLGNDAVVEQLAGRYLERLATPEDRAILRLIATRTPLDGTAEEVAAKIADHTRALREAIDAGSGI